MKKLVFVVLALVAVFIVLFNINDDVWYETHVLLVRTIAKEDGIYCFTPYTCIGVIHEYKTLYNATRAYTEECGTYCGSRQNKKYKYNSDMHAYVRWYEF